jgi:hypothetical protein
VIPSKARVSARTGTEVNDGRRSGVRQKSGGEFNYVNPFNRDYNMHISCRVPFTVNLSGPNVCLKIWSVANEPISLLPRCTFEFRESAIPESRECLPKGQRARARPYRQAWRPWWCIYSTWRCIQPGIRALRYKVMYETHQAVVVRNTFGMIS